MRKFNVGDKVQIKQGSNCPPLDGCFETIAHINISNSLEASVQFYYVPVDAVECVHSCEGFCPNNLGRFFSLSELEFVENCGHVTDKNNKVDRVWQAIQDMCR